jgi:hypothetical protein
VEDFIGPESTNNGSNVQGENTVAEDTHTLKEGSAKKRKKKKKRQVDISMN